MLLLKIYIVHTSLLGRQPILYLQWYLQFDYQYYLLMHYYFGNQPMYCYIVFCLLLLLNHPIHYYNLLCHGQFAILYMSFVQYPNISYIFLLLMLWHYICMAVHLNSIFLLAQYQKHQYKFLFLPTVGNTFVKVLQSYMMLFSIRYMYLPYQQSIQFQLYCLLNHCYLTHWYMFVLS